MVKVVVVPEEGNSHAAYRSSLAASFLFEFLNSFSSVVSSISGGLSEELNDLLLEGAGKFSNDGTLSSSENKLLLSSAKYVVNSSGDYYHVGEPMPKFGAAIQASSL